MGLRGSDRFLLEKDWRGLLTKRLFSISFAAALAHSLLQAIFLALAMQPLEPGPLPPSATEQELLQAVEKVIEQRMLVLLCARIALPSTIVAFAILVYFFCRPAKLEEEYKSILLAIFSAALAGEVVATPLGVIVRGAHLHVIPFELLFRIPEFLGTAALFTLVGFAAATVSYLRRGAGRGSDDLPPAARAGGWAQIAAP